MKKFFETSYKKILNIDEPSIIAKMILEGIRDCFLKKYHGSIKDKDNISIDGVNVLADILSTVIEFSHYQNLNEEEKTQVSESIINCLFNQSDFYRYNMLPFEYPDFGIKLHEYKSQYSGEYYESVLCLPKAIFCKENDNYTLLKRLIVGAIRNDFNHIIKDTSKAQEKIESSYYSL